MCAYWKSIRIGVVYLIDVLNLFQIGKVVKESLF